MLKSQKVRSVLVSSMVGVKFLPSVAVAAVLMFFAVLLAPCTVRAVVVDMTGEWANYTAFPNAAPSLLSTATLDANPLNPTGNENTGTSWALLTDGAFGSADGPAGGPGAGGPATAYIYNGYTLTYTLDSVYNLSAIDTYSAWGDGGRFHQDYTVRYQTAGSSDWTDLTTVAYHPGDGTDAHVNLAITGLENVQAVQFYFHDTQNGAVGYRELVVQGTSAIPAMTWNGGLGTEAPADGGGTWNAGNINWWGTAPTTWADSSIAVFGAGNGAAGEVIVEGTVKPTAVTFNAAGSGTYTLSQGTDGNIDLNGNVVKVTANVNAEIAATITNGGLNKSGAGTLILSGANTYTGATTVSDGTLTFVGRQLPGNVAQFVGHPKRGFAGPLNGPAVTGRGVATTRCSPRTPFPLASCLRGRHRRLAILSPYHVPPLFTFSRNEAVGGLVPQQVGAQHVLPLGTNEDHPLTTMMFGLVGLGPVAPHSARGVHVAWAEDADFAGSATGKPLEPYHIGNDLRQVGYSGVDNPVSHRPDRLGLAGRAMPFPQSRHRRQSLMDRDLDHLLGYGPLEHLLDRLNEPVDIAATIAGLGQTLLNRLQGQGAEVLGQRVAIGFLEMP
jgi:autotransporter-associated beta strand protein